MQDDVLKALRLFLDQKREELHLVIVTGDLTQRATKKQFEEAQTFIKQIPIPVFLVPGNHDVPLYNLFLRFFRPYKKFSKFLEGFTHRSYEDDSLQVYGLWTLNRFSVKDGRVPVDEVEQAKVFFQDQSKFRIIAAHHPMENFKNFSLIEALKPDLILSGHEHQSSVRALGKDNTPPLLIASGTSTSNRLREELNSFNHITVDGDQILIQLYVYNERSEIFQLERDQIVNR